MWPLGFVCPCLLSHRCNLLTLCYLWVSLNSHASCSHWNYVFKGHREHYMWMGQQVLEDRLSVFQCSNELQLQNPSSKIKILRISISNSKTFKQVWDFSEHESYSLPGLYLHKAGYDFIRKWQAVFEYSCTISHFHQ